MVPSPPPLERSLAMPNDIRLRRLQEQVKQRAAQVILHELKDPRLGFITVTRVDLSRDLSHAIVHWSVIGTEGEKSKSTHALEASRGFVQAAVAKIMGTRVTPRLQFQFDPGPGKAQQITETLNRLEQERREHGKVGSESESATDDDGSEE
jgi:ribosome-binding factor A